MTEAITLMRRKVMRRKVMCTSMATKKVRWAGTFGTKCHTKGTFNVVVCAGRPVRVRIITFFSFPILTLPSFTLTQKFNNIPSVVESGPMDTT